MKPSKMKNKIIEHIEENIKALAMVIEYPEISLEAAMKVRGAIAAFTNLKEFVETLKDEA